MTPNINPKNRHHRYFVRQSFKSTMRYRPEQGAAPEKEAVLLNWGVGGVCFEAQEHLRAGTRLYLIIDQPGSSEEKGSNQQNVYLATVHWCHELRSPVGGGYGVGAMFVRNECEWCGEAVPYEHLHTTESKTILCNRCLHDLEEFYSGRLKLSMINKLLGNIL